MTTFLSERAAIYFHQRSRFSAIWVSWIKDFSFTMFLSGVPSFLDQTFVKNQHVITRVTFFFQQYIYTVVLFLIGDDS